LGTGVPPWGLPPHPGPALHSFGRTALHWAAFYGNRRIVRSLVASGADVNAQDRVGCAVSACSESAECAGPIPRRRLPCRDTPLHYAADNGEPDNVAELLLRGADGAVWNNNLYRCAAPHS
jgi:ankyrin repeat protein